MALEMGDYVVTESGFGADCGAEKFFNIKCRASGLVPDACVLVATVRALKMHSGEFSVIPGKALPAGLLEENIPALRKGASNLVKHIENVRKFKVPVVVAINRFETDTDAEMKEIEKIALKAGADAAVVSDVHAKGGKGGAALAEAVVEACEKPSDFRLLYPDEAGIREKIETIATEIYGADGVDYTPATQKKINSFHEMGFGKLPMCMAKTHLSLSHDPSLKGAPSGWRLPIKDIKVSAGAGFLYALCGDMRTMPGLPSVPAGTKVDMDENGVIKGLF